MKQFAKSVQAAAVRGFFQYTLTCHVHSLIPEQIRNTHSCPFNQSLSNPTLSLKLKCSSDFNPGSWCGAIYNINAEEVL